MFIYIYICIYIAERADFGPHIQRVRAADMFLDCFTYNAHTTAVDSLWVCVCGCVGAWGRGGVCVCVSICLMIVYV